RCKAKPSRTSLAWSPLPAEMWRKYPFPAAPSDARGIALRVCDGRWFRHNPSGIVAEPPAGGGGVRPAAQPTTRPSPPPHRLRQPYVLEMLSALPDEIRPRKHPGRKKGGSVQDPRASITVEGPAKENDMPPRPLQGVIHHLRRVVSREGADDPTDA